MSEQDGGPAFPQPFATAHPEFDEHGQVRPSGLSVRDYFAGQALAGLLAATGVGTPVEQYAETAYRLADAVLAARAQPKAQP